MYELRLKSDIGLLKNIEFSIGKVIGEEWAEEVGPTQFPSIVDLRE
jgi:CO dehydrogenase/acetyl-CoA synthase alpha subunit